MAALASVLALALALLAAAAGVQSRYVIVGDPTAESPWTHIGVNYTQWTTDNPLYVGDIAVFQYKAHYHMVGQLPDLTAFETCSYQDVNFIANETAGVGAGFRLEVTAEPKYLGCMILGHCEAGQKVIINGSLGPLPNSLIPPPAAPSPPLPPSPPLYAIPPLTLVFAPLEPLDIAPPSPAPAPAPFPSPVPSPPAATSPPPPGGATATATAPPPSMLPPSSAPALSLSLSFSLAVLLPTLAAAALPYL